MLSKQKKVKLKGATECQRSLFKDRQKAKTQGKWSGDVKSTRKIDSSLPALYPTLETKLAAWLQQCRDCARPILTLSGSVFFCEF